MRGIAEEQYRAMREAWDRARVRAAEPPAPPRDRDEVA